ncbi:hypothetical protein IH992_34405 [Candidatus Poribacteria bacterium]|nr:hypothetical protein [Candidatus Poribacteria bacterium]
MIYTRTDTLSGLAFSVGVRLNLEISSSTTLNLEQFQATQTSEVNILSFSYGEVGEKTAGLIELSDGVLFAVRIPLRVLWI